LATLITLIAPPAQPVSPPEPEPSPIRVETPLQVKEETAQDIISRYSSLWDKDTEEIALAIASVESEFNPNAQSKTSSAKGLFQFIDGTWKENCEGDPLNSDDNAKCAVNLIGKGELWQWDASKDKWLPLLSPTLQSKIKEECSCVVYARNKGLHIKGNASEQVPNSMPAVGGGILLKYPNASHIAIIKDITDEGFLVSESNFYRCKKSERLISFNDKFIKGFIK